MEVFHSTKVTHNFIASKKHIGGFFEALSRMCEDQTYTDLHLVAGDGQIFAAHQVCALSNMIQFQFTRIPKTLFICEGWYTHLRSLHMQSWFVYYTYIVLIDGMKWCVFYVELSYILNVFLCLNVELFVVFINIYEHSIPFIC